MALQFVFGPIGLIVLVVVVFLLWKVFKFTLKKIFSILGSLAGIGVLISVFINASITLTAILAGIGIIFAALAGFF